MTTTPAIKLPSEPGKQIINTIYLAGPMRNYDDFNFPAFFAAAEDLRGLGYEVLSPADHDVEMGLDYKNPDLDGQGFNLEASMHWDLTSVLQSDAVVVLPGWEASTGVGHEVAVARCTGRPVLEYPSLKPVKEESVAKEAHRLVRGNRQASYGHPADDFTRTGRIWGAILGCDDIPPELVGLCMAAVKISREVNGHKRDNLVDLAGYAETVHLVHERNGS
jgi:hypothetical protein